MLYPIISSKLNYKKSLDRINNYASSVSNNTDKINETILKQAEKYNLKIVDNYIQESFIEEREASDEYLGLLNIESDGIMGYIKIPKIDVEIPIYHSTSSKSLQKGVGHFEGSSLPVGGKNTHAILSGHRGLPSSKVFTDLDQLKKNDMFYIYVLDKILAYKVDQIKIVKPSETKDLNVIDGKDYVTLVTCTPYAINTHRLLVRGKRVDYDENVLNNIKVSKKITAPDIIFIGGLIIAFIIVIFTIRKILKINRRRKVRSSSTTKKVITSKENNTLDKKQDKDKENYTIDKKQDKDKETNSKKIDTDNLSINKLEEKEIELLINKINSKKENNNLNKNDKILEKKDYEEDDDSDDEDDDDLDFLNDSDDSDDKL